MFFLLLLRLEKRQIASSLSMKHNHTFLLLFLNNISQLLSAFRSTSLFDFALIFFPANNLPPFDSSSFYFNIVTFINLISLSAI